MKTIKTTVKGVLINISNEYLDEINELMTVFSSAKRFAFKRLNEGKIKKGELEKLIAHKYGINIRQSKDAAQAARQMIASQKSLIKDYYENYARKVKAIEKQLEKAKSQKKTHALVNYIIKLAKNSNLKIHRFVHFLLYNIFKKR